METEELLNYIRKNYAYRNGCLYMLPMMKKCGTLNSKGRYTIKIKNKQYYLSRIIFLKQKGYLPEIVDHIDRDSTNNRIENLRDATFAQNSFNKHYSGLKKSELKGVYKNTKDRYKVMLRFDGKLITAGQFDTQEEAAAFYNKMAKLIYGEFAYLNPE